MIQSPTLPPSDFDEGNAISIPGGTIGSMLVWMELDGWSEPEGAYDPRHHAYVEFRYRIALASRDQESLGALVPLLIKLRNDAIVRRSSTSQKPTG